MRSNYMTRQEIEQWVIHGIIPGDYETYGDWILQTSPHIVNLVGGGIVYHNHGAGRRTGGVLTERVLYAILPDGKCRYCGKPAPPGVIFRAKTYKLQGAHSEEPQ
jgi:hypothetical protein